MSSSLLATLKAGTDNKKTIKFPGTDQDVVIRVLSEAERQAAAFATEQRFQSQNIEPTMTTVDVYEQEKTTQLLYRALGDPDDAKKPIAKNIDEFRSNLTLEEKNVLVDEYEALEKECSPNPEYMSDEEFDTLLEGIKKNAEATASNVSSIATARRLIVSLAGLLQSSQQANGSTS